MSDKIIKWVLDQWKRRGIISDEDDARDWLARQSAEAVERMTRRMETGWQVPKV